MTVMEVREFQVTIPQGTTANAPLVSSLAMPPRTVETLTIKVPPGPSGLMGFRITMAGNPVIPIVAGSWIITDDETIELTLTDLPDSGAWQLTGYNGGNYDHVVNVRFGLSLPGSQKPPVISATGDLNAASSDALLAAVTS